MNFYVATLFPEQVTSYLNTSITGRGIAKGAISLECIQMRDYAPNNYGRVDDTIYGGGTGMMIRPEPVYGAYEKAVELCGGKKPHTVYMSPKGQVFNQAKAHELASKPDPPPSQNKPAAYRPAPREDAVQSGFYPQKSFPEKAPANGVEQTQKTVTPAYNRFTPKPYTSSARPFERKFESPKFNHNLLPNETAHKPDLSSKAPASPKTLLKSAQPPEFDSGVETLSVHTDNKLKYQVNSVSMGPRAVPVR